MNRWQLLRGTAGLCLGLLFASLWLPGEAWAQVPVSLQVQQSAWQQSELEGASLEVELTVANQGSQPVENVVLVLPSGIETIETSSRAATVDQGAALWPLGSLSEGDSASVTVTLPGEVGQLLPGARAHVVVGGRPAVIQGRPVWLAGDNFPGDFLGATPDADPGDPSIQHQAALLGGDPERIFAFVQRQIAHQPYVGSLHGARGALYEQAGNATDRANLLVALLRASGIPAGYRFGALPQDSVERLAGSMFPPTEATDRGGQGLSVLQLRAHPETLLELLVPEARQDLGDTLQERLATLSLLPDEELEDRLFEHGLEEALRARLGEHTWVEAWIGESWVSLDPSFLDLPMGQAEIPGPGPLERAMPEARRHKVALRMLRERFQPVWGLGQRRRTPAYLEVVLGAGDLVGRSVSGVHETQQNIASGFIFSTTTQDYRPSLEIRDLERPGQVQTLEGEPFQEIQSSFLGPLAADHTTAVWLEVELLAPGQAPGAGEVHPITLGDRLPTAVRLGAPFSGDLDFNSPVADTMDTTTLMIGAAHAPPRVAALSREVLQVQARQFQANFEARMMEDPEGEGSLEAEDFMQGRAVLTTTSELMLLLHDTHSAERSALLAQSYRQRLYHDAPRIRVATHRVHAQQALAIDLVRDRVETVGAPGQLRRDRTLMRAAYGSLVTDLEGELLQAMAPEGSVAISTGSVFIAAADAGIPVVFLIGQDGLARLDAGLLPFSQEAQARLRVALRRGDTVMVPQSPVELGGAMRLAWFEFAPDGSTLGRLEDGSGGAAIEYALFTFQSVCALLGHLPACQTPLGRSFLGNLGSFLGRLWGVITGSLSAVSLCISGSDTACEKLSTGAVNQVANQQIALAYANLIGYGPMSAGDCTVPLIVVNGVNLEVGCDACGLGTLLVEGVCNAVTALSESNNAIISAALDPVQPARPAGVMDARPGGPRALRTALQPRAVEATLPRASVSGGVTVDHARVTGAQAWTWQSPGQATLARALEAPGASVSQQGELLVDRDAHWQGVDQLLAWTGPGGATLRGQGALDLYAGAVEGSLVGAGDWPEGYSLELLGQDQALALDTRVEALGFSQAGALRLEGQLQRQDRYEVQAPMIALGGRFAGPLATSRVTAELTSGGLLLTGARGELEINGLAQPALPNQAFGGASGTLTVTPGEGGDLLTVDLTGAHQLRLEAPAQVDGQGAFVVPVALSSSLGGEFTLEATAPPGWSVRWSGQDALVQAGPGVEDGQAVLRLVARGPAGLEAAHSTVLTLARPEQAQVELALVEDTRNAVEFDGVRSTAWIVELRHQGQRPGRYTLSAELSDARLQPVLAGSEVLVEPGDVRRLGLVLRPSVPGGPWPEAERPLTLTLRASGDAEASLEHRFTLPRVTHLGVTLEQGQLLLLPGQEADVPVHVQALGNAPVTPRLRLVLPSGLDGALSPPSGPLAPGASETLTLHLRALGQEEDALPLIAHVQLIPAPTDFEQARGLDPAPRKLTVYLARPGTESLVELMLRGSRDLDLELVHQIGQVVVLLRQLEQSCGQGDTEALAVQVEGLVDALERRYGASDTTASLRQRAQRLRDQGCVALEEPVLVVEGVEELRRGPDLAGGLLAPREVIAGDTVSLRAQVFNHGDAATPSTVARLLAGPSGSLALVHEEVLPALEPDEGVEFSFDLPTGGSLGGLLAVLEVDPEQAALEADRSNNRASASVQVVPGGVAPPENRPPAFLGTPPSSALVGSDLDYDPQVEDPDGDPVLVSLVNRAPGLQLRDGHLVGRVNRPGAYDVALVAVDRYGVAATQEFSLEIRLDQGPNAAPVITSRPGRRLLAEQPWSYRPEALDPDGDALSWQLLQAPEGATLGGEPLALLWTPGAQQAGLAWFSLQVSDEGGAVATQRFSVEARAEPLGPDLAVVAVETDAVVDSPAGQRSGQARVTVVNLGDQEAPGSRLALYEERDGQPGPGADDVALGELEAPALASGASVALEVRLEGPVAFGGNILFAQIDADDLVVEPNEDNNRLYSGQARPQATHSLLGYMPEEASLVLLSAQRDPVAYRVLDPLSGAVAQEGTLEPMQPLVVDTAWEGAPLQHLVVESDAPVQGWLTREIFEPDFGGDFFHPALDGHKVGRSFALYAPTLTSNNRLLVVALETSLISLEDAQGDTLEQIGLVAGQVWEPAGLIQGQPYRLEASGDLVVQSASVTGFSVVPPAQRALAALGDVGQEFRFSVRSRGPGGGALAVIAYEDASYTLETNDGNTLLSGQVLRGQVAFHSNLGERLGLWLRASAPVSVLAGDMAQLGADEIGLMGEDITQLVGQGGSSLRGHSLRQAVGDSVVLAGPEGAALQINGQPMALPPYGLLPLEEDQIFEISASPPVMVQLIGGGERHFDMGDALRALPMAQVAPRAVLWGVDLRVGACASRLEAHGRLGNGGNAAIPAGARVEFVALGADGEEVLDNFTLTQALEPGQWADFSLEAQGRPEARGQSWLLRTVGVGPGLDLWRSGPEGLLQSRCLDQPPVFVSQPSLEATQGEAWVYPALAEDPEGLPLRYELLASPPGATIEPLGGLLRWQAGATPQASFTLRATDAAGQSALQSFVVAVRRAPGPDCQDNDGDGACAPLDCDDDNPEVHPGRQELPGDGLDNDCSPLTPDAPSPQAARLVLGTDASDYRLGDTVVVLAHVENVGQVQSLSGLTLEVDLSCGASTWTLQRAVPTLGPRRADSLRLPWAAPAQAMGQCQALGRLRGGDQLLAQASARFWLRPDLRASLEASAQVISPGEPLTLTWTLHNATQVERPLSVSLRLLGAAAPLEARDLTLAPQERLEASTEVNTADLPPSMVQVSLQSGGATLATTAFRIRGPASLQALHSEDPQADDLSGAAPSPVVLRPLGPRPGASPRGGQLRAVWSPEALLLEIQAQDSSPEAGDSLELRLALGESSLLAARWTGEQAVELPEGSGISAELAQVGPQARTLRLRVPPAALGLERWSQDSALLARVGLRDGDAQAPRDLWLWATDAALEDDLSAYGAIALLPPEPIEPDPDPDPDMGMDMDPGDTQDMGDEPDMEPDTGSDMGARPDDPDLGSEGRADAEEEQDMTPDVSPTPDGGCDCQSVHGARQAPSRQAWWLLLLLALAPLRRRRQAARLLGAAALVLGLGALLGCDDDPPPVLPVDKLDMGQEEDSGGHSGDPDLGEDEPDQGAPQDLGPGQDSSPDPDLGEDEPDQGEEEPDLTEEEPDITEDEPEIPSGEVFGEPCVEDEDCRSRICLQGVDMAVCSESCDLYACPEGWVCAAWPGGARLCVPARACLDQDEDGYGTGRGCQGEDCDDSDPAIHAGVEEICDGVDNDCDGRVDEGVSNACGGCGPVPEEICDGVDNDCDGDVDEGLRNACGQCGQTGFPEVCNGLDDDCDGAIDEGEVCPEGCPEGDTRPCYGGPPETRGQGSCQDGAQTCRAGAWGECEGDVRPGEEACDEQDNDCDGGVDEGLRNACGTCGPPPEEVCNGEDDNCDGLIDEGVQTRCGGCAPCGEALFFPGESGQQDAALAPAPDGAVTLGSGQLERHFLWVPNSDEDTISRWDTRTGREESRYFIGENPSRTAVDLSGNVWVGNRGDGKATHIFSDLRDCVDRNGDGVIQTSRDLNGDGRITAGEMVGSLANPLADECVHCQVQVGTNNDLVRGVAIDAEGYAWLGTWNSRELYKVHPDTCEVVAQLSTVLPGQNNTVPVYGLVVDGEGFLWTASYTGRCSVKVDTAREEVVAQVCDNSFTNYGLAVDARNRIWWGDYENGVWFYDPVQETLNHATDPENRVRRATGIVAGLDGMIYVAAYDSHLIGKLNPEEGTWEYLPTNVVPEGMQPQTNPRGVTIDDDGALWAICRGSSGLLKMTTDGEVLGSYPVRGALNPSAGTGPYSYSDNTGFQLFNFTVREGRWRHTFDAGALVRFVSMTWSPFIPDGTRVDVKVRAADTEGGLEELAFSTPTALTEVDLRALTPESARFLQMEFTLAAEDPVQRPVLRDIQIFFETQDCRQVACPQGQLCNQRDGGCVVLPRDCVEDAACRDNEYCDENGFCRQGCRTSPESCSTGQRCDERTHLCDARASECNQDLHCAAGLWCAPGGFCDPGCRTDPDDCPFGFACDEGSRQCQPLPPECATDTDCDQGRFCGPEGTCLTGCRATPDGCPEGQACDTNTRRCADLPLGCDPELATEEVCDGLDNDCDGQIDEDISQEGETCAVGNLASGRRVCDQGVLWCRADASADPEMPTPLQGLLESALLPEGHYAVAANISYRGPLRLDPGASVSAPEGSYYTLNSASGAQHLLMSGATLTRLGLNVRPSFALLEDSTFVGLRNHRSNTLHSDGPLVARGLRLENFTLSTGNSAMATVERSTLVSDDSYGRYLAIFRAPAVVVDNQATGLNLIPRVHRGLQFLGNAAGSTVARNRLERLREGIQINLTGSMEVEENTILGADAGIQVEGNAFPTLTGNFLDQSDPGHVGVGIYFTGLLQGAGAQVRDNRLRLGPDDAAFELDPDVFQVETPSVFEGNRLEGQVRHDAVRIRGDAVGGALHLRPVAGQETLALSQHVVLRGDLSATTQEGLRLVAITPDRYYRLYLRSSGHLEAHDLHLEDVGFSVEVGGEAVVEGSTFTRSLAQNSYLITTTGSLTLSNSSLTSQVPTTGSSRVSRGIQAEQDSLLQLTGVSFYNLDYGLVLHHRTQAQLRGLRLENCAHGLWMGVTAVADPAMGITVVEQDPELTSRGIELAIDRGGRGAFLGTTFDIGAEDTPWFFDADTFQAENLTTLSGTTYLNDQVGQGLRLRGDMIGGAGVLRSFEDNVPMTLGETVYIQAGAQFVLEEGAILQGPGTLVVRNAGSQLTATGALLRDVTLGVHDSAQATLEGCTFENTEASGSRTNLDVTAQATAINTDFLGFGRRQRGVDARSGGAVSLSGGRIEQMDIGAYAQRGGQLTATGVLLVGSVRNLYLTHADSSLRAESCTLRSGDPAHNTIGLEVAAPGASMSLIADSLHFDYEPGDVSYRFEQGAFRADSALSVSGSTFEDGESGRAYQLHGDIRDVEVTLVMLEPAQSAYELINNMRTYGAASLTLADGLQLQVTGTRRYIEARDNSLMTVQGAALRNVRLVWRHSSQGTLDGADFTCDTNGQLTFVAIGDTASGVVQNASFTRGAEGVNDLWGVHVFGTGALSPTLTDNVFNEIRYGIALDNGHSPTLSGNVFNGCDEDVFYR